MYLYFPGAAVAVATPGRQRRGRQAKNNIVSVRCFVSKHPILSAAAVDAAPGASQPVTERTKLIHLRRCEVAGGTRLTDLPPYLLVPLVGAVVGHAVERVEVPLPRSVCLPEHPPRPVVQIVLVKRDAWRSLRGGIFCTEDRCFGGDGRRLYHARTGNT